MATDVELVLEKEAMEADSAVIFTESLHLTKWIDFLRTHTYSQSSIIQ